MKEFFEARDHGWQDYNWTLSPDGKLLALCKEMRVSKDAQIRLIPVGGGSERTFRCESGLGFRRLTGQRTEKFLGQPMLRGEIARAGQYRFARQR